MWGLIDAWESASYEEFAMQTVLLFLIVLLAGAICAFAGYWFYRAARERKQSIGSPQISPQIARRSIRNDAWDRAVRAARNRNW